MDANIPRAGHAQRAVQYELEAATSAELAREHEQDAEQALGQTKAHEEETRALLVKTTETPELRKAFEQQLTQVYVSSPAEFRDLVAKEAKTMGPVVKTAGLKVE